MEIKILSVDQTWLWMEAFHLKLEAEENPSQEAIDETMKVVSQLLEEYEDDSQEYTLAMEISDAMLYLQECVNDPSFDNPDCY